VACSMPADHPASCNRQRENSRRCGFGSTGWRKNPDADRPDLGHGHALSKTWPALLRQQVIAPPPRVRAAYDAYNYALRAAGCLLILLGGINGPSTRHGETAARRPPRKAHVASFDSTPLVGSIAGVTFLLWPRPSVIIPGGSGAFGG